jgi:hypothetical protein
MKNISSKLLLASIIMMTLSAPAFAQDATNNDQPVSTKGQPLGEGEETQRDINQQDRIENGLKDGQLSTGEAAKLEKDEAKIDKMEAKDMKDGTLTDKEKAQIQKEQNRASKDIYEDKHNKVGGNPDSTSSERMQADVQRNINQEQRTHDGIENGSLTNKEAGQLEKGQARVDRTEAQAGKDGFVGKHEQRKIQRRENRQSGKIHHKKHNGRRHKHPGK